MKNINKLAAAVGLALSVGFVSQVAASCCEEGIQLKHNGQGDALIFPVYNGYVDNYFTIMNNHDEWIQGHIRFRGAAWSSEVLDFDVILSPGDVFVFRLADLDSDGYWEIDQSLDKSNFLYTGNGDSTCSNYKPYQKEGDTELKVPDCMEMYTTLVPPLDTVINQDLIDHQLHVGHVEFIGEAVLKGMTGEIMADLLSDAPGDLAQWQTKQGSKRGTTAWAWTNAGNKFTATEILSQYVTTDGVIYTYTYNDVIHYLDDALAGVPNVLSGSAFIFLPGQSQGITYNAEALVNFRTANNPHRIDNYFMYHQPTPSYKPKSANETPDGTYVSLRMAWPEEVKNMTTDQIVGLANSLSPEQITQVNADREVILHDENVSGAADADPYLPYGDYIFQFGNQPGIDDRYSEAALSFQNTWGPTLADGDDYNLYGVRPTFKAGNRTDYPDLVTVRPLIRDAETADDDFDSRSDISGLLRGLDVPNSIAEVEEAIREGGQTFTAFYFDGSRLDEKSPVTLKSMYFAVYPTKYFWAMRDGGYGTKNLSDYSKFAVRWLLEKPKPYQLEVWDISENSACKEKPKEGGIVSPWVVNEETGNPCVMLLRSEVNFFDITNIKSSFPEEAMAPNYPMGRVVLAPAADANDPMYFDPQGKDLEVSWPGLMYTFELGPDWSIGQWRSMNR